MGMAPVTWGSASVTLDGMDCSRKKAGLPLEPSRISQQGWLKTTVVEALAAMEPPPKPTRKRPLIYVYDLEPLYSQKMLQYRIPSSWCVHRKYDQGNNTVFIDYWVYAVDTLLHEMLLQSEHRTFNPDEADFFYVPQYSTCFIYPIKEWAVLDKDLGMRRKCLWVMKIVLEDPPGGSIWVFNDVKFEKSSNGP